MNGLNSMDLSMEQIPRSTEQNVFICCL